MYIDMNRNILLVIIMMIALIALMTIFMCITWGWLPSARWTIISVILLIVGYCAAAEIDAPGATN